MSTQRKPNSIKSACRRTRAAFSQSRVRWLAIALALVSLTATQAALQTSSVFTGTTTGNVSLGTVSSYTCSAGYQGVVTGTPGLTNYWRLGDGAGTTATATTGGVNGTYTNGVTKGQPGARASMGSDSSALFDGVDDYVNIADIADYTGTSSFSIEAWVMRTGGDGWKRVVSKEVMAPTRNGWALAVFPEADGYVPVVERWNNDAKTGVMGSTRLELNRWYHLVATYAAGTNNFKLYVNGALEAQTTSAISLPNTSVNVNIGRNPYGSDQFQGGIDEVALYNQVMTPAKIQEHYEGCGTDYAATILATSNLLSYHRLNEASGTSAADLGPQGSTGTYVNNPTRSVAGATTDGDTGITVATASSQMVTAGTSSTYGFNAKTPYTIEGWIKPATPVNQLRYIFSKYNNWSTRDGWAMYMDNNAARVTCERYTNGSYSGAGSTTNMNTTTWYHVACVYDGSTIKTYVNGVSEGSNTSSGSMIATTTYPYTIGAQSWSSGRYHYAGGIDDVAIYNRALSAAELLAHYNAR